MKRTIINITSGKGGTGKTLLACVLADMLGNTSSLKVAVVDLDFFVRGLTSLLYFHSEEKLHLTKGKELPVSSYFIKKYGLNSFIEENLAILKYRSFDVVPAVSRIDERLNFQDIGPDNRREASDILQRILLSIPSDYDIIILDSRAGYDELVAATHMVSNVTLCVEEPDPISKVTADNLVAQLNADGGPPIFRVTNKARGTRFDSELLNGSRGVNDLGSIPFDMEVMNTFGTSDFWDKITGSLYRSALGSTWNRLSKKMDLKIELKNIRISPLITENFENRVSILPAKERIIFIYGIFVSIMGFSYGIGGREFFLYLKEDPIRMVSIIMGITGASISLFAFFRKRK